ncbi:DUF1801 domain-containing protein [Demequina sp. SYSU T00192]|uniref:DUF1801 domain-containing protein n=1 Tax=Demequina litoralis TaxID=3051660 RepID=A0ABT8G599_9MICO|nr:DUF1801 domain-containing protein [Demequina sp. SYSU T00192]MDN4474313.1 DUF1801 domain-containing protein [Demequina sp. SYSU T00192]
MNKTVPTDVPVEAFVAAVEPARRREEAERIVALFTEVTGVEPVMWGPSIIGWGSMHYRYASGREGDMPALGFSPRKAQLTFYGFKDTPEGEGLLTQLGPHTASVACVYVKRLDTIDLEVLADLAEITFTHGDSQ